MTSESERVDPPTGSVCAGRSPWHGLTVDVAGHRQLTPVLHAATLRAAAAALAGGPAHRPLIKALGAWSQQPDAADNLGPLTAAIVAGRSDCVPQQVAAVIIDAADDLPALTPNEIDVLVSTLAGSSRKHTCAMLCRAVATRGQWNVLRAATGYLTAAPPAHIGAVPNVHRWAANVARRTQPGDGSLLTMQVVVQRLHNTTTPDGLTVSVPATVGQLTAVGHAFRNCLDEQALDYAVRPLRVVTVTDAGDRPVAVGHIHHTPGGRVGLAELLGPENGPVADDVAADIVQHVQAVLADAGPL